MRNYDMAAERKELIERSKALFFKTDGATITCSKTIIRLPALVGNVINADGSYDWGALLVFMEFIEKGLIK